MERKCIALGKHMVIPEDTRLFVSAHWVVDIHHFYCAYCGKPLKTYGLSSCPMINSSVGDSIYNFSQICYCHDDGLDGHDLFFRIIKHKDGKPERYQLGFCLTSSGRKIHEYLEEDGDEMAVDGFLPVRDFWKSCYLLPDGNLLVPATDGNLFMMVLCFDNKTRNVTKRYYDEKYEVIVRQNGFQRPIIVTGDADVEFDFSVRKLNDENVAMSNDGLAIKCHDKWLAYSKTNSTLYTVEEKRITECPLYVVPTFGVEMGDLVCNDGRYYFVTSTNGNMVLGRDDMPAFRVDDHRISPECKILGVSIYYKVLAATDVAINTKGNISGMPSSRAILSDAAMAKIFMLSSMMENSGKPGLKNLLVPLSFTTNKNIDVVARTVMLYAMLDGMFGSK